jgi:exosortase A-associated hydrolase 2
MLAAETFLLPVDTGFRFCLLHRPDPTVPMRAAIVVAPPFAEELNKSRRMLALAARTLAQQGCAVLQIDCLGCGDSSGDFADATWDAWIDDIARGHAWLAAQFHVPTWIWGVRAGALLAAAALGRINAEPHLLLWQPVVAGRQHLAQFLRVETTAAMLRDAQPAKVQTLLERLQAGEFLEVGGYTLSPALAFGLHAAELALPASFRGRIVCLEVGSHPAPTAAVAARVVRWTSEARRVEMQIVEGPSFWQTAEIAVAPQLIEATASALRSDGP